MFSKRAKVPLAQPVLSTMHMTAAEGNDAVIRFYIKCGQCDLNERDELGSALLHTASACGQVPVVQLLVTQGADITAKNAAGQTPWDVAEDELRAACPELNPQTKN